jgi:hypothetical protein
MRSISKRDLDALVKHFKGVGWEETVMFIYKLLRANYRVNAENRILLGGEIKDIDYVELLKSSIKACKELSEK